jgi:SAM-dependent methyltransferase
MEKITDWAQLWRELSQAQARSWNKGKEPDPRRDADAWHDKARSYYAGVRRRWAQPDSSRARVVQWLDENPGSTAMDIGAGPGAWTVLMAQHAREVTAVEPSSAMIEVLQENVAAAGLTNVKVVQASWPHAEVEPHDATLCFHAMYGYPDLPAFLRRMMTATRHTCFLGLRVPTQDGLMAEAARRIWGHDYDSPNFQVAYNVLLQMGICANVLMEDTGLWEPWISPSIEDALSDVKRRFGLAEHSEYDEWLTDLLRHNLTPVEDHYVWPRGVRSALVWWDVTPARLEEAWNRRD